MPQTYNDGLCRIYRIENSGKAGLMPRPKPLHLATLRYDERTVGVTRYWQAKQNNARIDRQIRVMRGPEVSPQDIVTLNDGKFYTIVQVQYPKEITPASVDLSLERTEQVYEVPNSD